MAARWAYNHAIAAKHDALHHRRLQIDEIVTRGLPETQARREATVKIPAKPAIQRRWNQLKGDDTTGTPGLAPWWSSETGSPSSATLAR